MTGDRNNEEFTRLVKKYMEGKASDGEILFLEKYYDYFEKEPAIIATLSETEKQALEEEIHQRIWKKKKQPARIVSLYKSKWVRVAAAAVLILLATGTFFLLNRQSQNESAKVNKELVTPDIKPGGNKAILTIGDNSQIVLNNMQNGILTQQGNTKVLKLDNGQLAYTLINEKPGEIFYNTLTTPKGGQYQLTLSDGTKVWLNAASSLRFPTSFSGKQRIVELTGEVYFEVAKNASMPFKVNVAGKGEVEVLGTHFNINSYSDEPTINTTLLEGSVKVTDLSTRNTQFLIPGQQAQVNPGNQVSINKNVDVDEVMAWKNGLFNFNSLDIENIMRQVARWYDAEISYEGKINKETYSGIVSRNSNISEVLKILEEGGVRFRIEGRKIIVLP